MNPRCRSHASMQAHEPGDGLSHGGGTWVAGRWRLHLTDIFGRGAVRPRLMDLRGEMMKIFERFMRRDQRRHTVVPAGSCQIVSSFLQDILDEPLGIIAMVGSLSLTRIAVTAWLNMRLIFWAFSALIVRAIGVFLFCFCACLPAGSKPNGEANPFVPRKKAEAQMGASAWSAWSCRSGRC